MMRYALLLIGCVVLTSGAGYAVCAMAGWNPHPQAMLLAAIGCAAGGVLGVLPMALVKNAPTDTAAQLALVSTFVHLAACVIAAAVVILAKLSPQLPFVYWLAAFYPISMIVLLTELVKRLRATGNSQDDT